MTQFEETVLADLATLKTHMKMLVGNGQPGRIAELEARVERHESLVQRLAGIGALFGLLLTALHLGAEYLRFKH